jgi:2-polyprenyl-3-methyl-5-hydroxy-6-metoxy-1,4-benzoquinol methylase
MPWRAVGDHPNSREALQYRHKQLAKAASTFKGGRIAVVKRFARDQKVLDMGCVSHNFAFNSGGRGRWLHQHVVDVAAECVGTDYDEAGIKEMREAGYDVIHADITGDLSALLERGPFDVVLAGEIIEHLPAPQQLFASAYALLRPGGTLVITTPNPYSPRRARAGALGLTWENADHVLYAFPSGVAEMADRTGLVLKRFGTVGWPGQVTGLRRVGESTKELVRAVRARAAGRRAVPRRGRANLPLSAHWLAPMDILLHVVRGRRRMLGETSIYVLKRPNES